MIKIEELTDNQKKLYRESPLFHQAIDYYIHEGERSIPYIIENLIDIIDTYYKKELERIKLGKPINIITPPQEFYD